MSSSWCERVCVSDDEAKGLDSCGVGQEMSCKQLLRRGSFFEIWLLAPQLRVN